MNLCFHCYQRLKVGRIWDSCQVCCGAFDRVSEFARKILDDLKDYEFESFQVGTRLRGSIKALEEFLKISGIEDDIKRTFNSALSRELRRLSGKRVSYENPDVTITFDLEDFSYEIRINPVYIYGRYIKRVRNISQTRWLCKNCFGKGCEICNYTGRKYMTSVEELIANPIIELFKADDAILHGAGREDVDARMLGNGRPFVIEVLNPRRRKIDLEEVEKAVNEFCEGKVSVKDLSYAKPRDVRKVKEERHRKVYRAKVVFEREIEEDVLRKALDELVGTIRQRTPKRVLHRRADKLRIRKLYKAEILLHRGKVAVLKFEAEAGLYIKELVSGDDGRTEPSLTSLLGLQARVEKLDVLEVK